MKLNPAWFYVVLTALASGVAAALSSGLVPAEYVAAVATVSTLLGGLVQKKG